MTHQKHNSFKGTLNSCFPEEWLRETAKEVGYLKRQRKVDVVDFFYNLLLCFGSGGTLTLEGIRRSFIQFSRVTIARSSFYKRLSKELVLLLKKAVEKACDTLCEPTGKLKGILSRFKDLIVIDSTVLKLHEFLGKLFPPKRVKSMKAAAKLHMVMSVSAVSPRTIQISRETLDDRKAMKISKWVKDRLLLMDLGYFSYSIFTRIAKNGGFYISRLMKHVNPEIVKENLALKKGKKSVLGKKLQEALPLLKRDVFDFEVETTFKKRKYRGKQKRHKGRFRIVGILNHDTGLYHMYITNVSPDVLVADDVARIYACRWEVELLFKELKSYYKLGELPSRNRHVVEALIYEAILVLILSRSLLYHLRKLKNLSASRTPERRWASVFRSFAPTLIRMISDPETPPEDLEFSMQFLAKEMVDPNARRPGIIEAAQL